MSNLTQAHMTFLFKRCHSNSTLNFGLYEYFRNTKQVPPPSQAVSNDTNHINYDKYKHSDGNQIGCSNTPLTSIRVCNIPNSIMPNSIISYHDYNNIDCFKSQQYQPWNMMTSYPKTMMNRARIIMSLSSINDAGSITRQMEGKTRDRSGSNQPKFKRSRVIRRVLLSLSVAGLFGRPIGDDVEEEKRKLTDEEKIKKMTPVQLLIAKGVLSLCDFEYDKAENLFHEALHLAQKDNNEEQEILVLNLLATNYFDSGQFDAAEKLFIDLIKRLIAQDVEPRDPAILELSLKLSSIYSKNPKNHVKAFKGFEFVINSLLYSLQDLLKNLDELNVMEISDQQRNDLALLGWAYDWFARHLMVLNDYHGALELLRKANDISTQVLGPTHDQTLILLNDIGTTLAMVNLPNEGRNYIKRAVEGALESQSRELASFYVNLGLVNLQLRKLDEAKRYCEYSTELVSKNANHHNTNEIVNLSQDCLSEIKRLLQVRTNQ